LLGECDSNFNNFVGGHIHNWEECESKYDEEKQQVLVADVALSHHHRQHHESQQNGNTEGSRLAPFGNSLRVLELEDGVVIFSSRRLHEPRIGVELEERSRCTMLLELQVHRHWNIFEFSTTRKRHEQLIHLK